LHYLPPEQLAGIVGFLGRAAPVLQGDWNALSLGAMLDKLVMGAELLPPGQQAVPQELLDELGLATWMLATAVHDAEAYQSPWSNVLGSADRLQELACRPFLADDGKLGFVTLKLAAADKESFDPHTKGLNALREIVAQVRAQHPETSIGLTGLPVIENDEMCASQNSMGQAGTLSFIGVALVFLVGFGGWRHPLIGNVALMAGMAWAFGFATLAIGHLNILSSAFGAILIGQGIDFGVYYLAGYFQHREKLGASSAALLETARSVGPGIATGAISTAIAFFAAGFTDFTGVAEMGIIAGGGILLCFAAATVVLPAMIQLFDSRRPAAAMPTQLQLGGVLTRLHSWPLLSLLALCALTAVAAAGLRNVWYDHNLMNLQPAGLESIRLASALAERTGQGTYFALSMANSREEALARKEAFLRQPSVARVEEIASLLPNADHRRQPLITQIHAQLHNLPRVLPQLAVATSQELDLAMARLQRLLPVKSETNPIHQCLARLRETLLALPASEVAGRVHQYQQRAAADLLRQLTLLQAVSGPTPPQWSDVSAGLAGRFVSASGKHLLKIFGKTDIWNMPATKRFIAEVRSVDRDATGNPMQIYESSQQMKKSYEQAAIYATVIVSLVVYFDFRDLRYTLLALLPLALGMLQMFGIMGLISMPLNAANMIVLPLILGIGVDNGVHIVHDFRHQPAGRYRISDSTASAVLINSLGNMVGFGSLMIASHRGLQSLGRVLTIGMACCLISALAMPSLLMLLRRRLPKADARDMELPDSQILPMGDGSAATHQPMAA
jgi:hopanoid biosynthesis associated RND transporter like protein HpnN